MEKITVDGSRFMTPEDFVDFVANYNGEDKYELLDGVLVVKDMASDSHQFISNEISFQLNCQLRDKGCVSVIETHLHFEQCSKSYYIPDIMVICGEEINKFPCKIFNGTPTIIIELWSSSNGAGEIATKRMEYQYAGVKEFWEINLQNKTVCVTNFVCKDIVWFSFKDGVDSIQFPGLHIDLSQFEDWSF